MKVKIEYEYDATREPHFFAVSEINGYKEFSGGKSWAQARERHIEKLERHATGQVPPPPETVEI